MTNDIYKRTGIRSLPGRTRFGYQLLARTTAASRLARRNSQSRLLAKYDDEARCSGRFSSELIASVAAMQQSALPRLTRGFWGNPAFNPRQMTCQTKFWSRTPVQNRRRLNLHSRYGCIRSDRRIGSRHCSKRLPGYGLRGCGQPALASRLLAPPLPGAAFANPGEAARS